MSLQLGRFVSQQGAAIGLPNKGDVQKQKKQKTGDARRKARTGRSAEARAEEARLNDPYGNAGRTRRPGGRTRVVRRRVRRRRVGGQAKPNYGNTQTKGSTQTAKSGRAQAQSGPQGPSNHASNHMMRSTANGSLAKMTSNFMNSQASQNGGPKTPVGKKMAMLSNLQNYMKNDYACMKANDGDKAFTYRTSEARQLCATLGTMVASCTKQGKSKDSKSSTTDNKTMSPKAFARSKGLLRRLKEMSDPGGSLPEGLPADYTPFESVA